MTVFNNLYSNGCAFFNVKNTSLFMVSDSKFTFMHAARSERLEIGCALFLFANRLHVTS